MKLEIERKVWALVTSQAATNMHTFVSLLWVEAFEDLCREVDSRRRLERVLREGVKQQRAGKGIWSKGK
jgi:hypothetical protein